MTIYITVLIPELGGNIVIPVIPRDPLKYLSLILDKARLIFFNSKLWKCQILAVKVRWMGGEEEDERAEKQMSCEVKEG